MPSVNPARPRAPSRRSAARQRGAIIVEALIVSSVLITILALGVYLYRAYAARYAALRDARLSAWSQAMVGCEAPPSAGALAPAVGSLGGEPQVSEGETLSWLLIEKRFGNASHTAEAVHRAGIPSKTMTGRVTVMCNEQTQEDSGVLGLVGYFTDNVMRLTD